MCKDVNNPGAGMMGDFWHMTWEETSDLGHAPEARSVLEGVLDSVSDLHDRLVTTYELPPCNVAPPTPEMPFEETADELGERISGARARSDTVFARSEATLIEYRRHCTSATIYRSLADTLSRRLAQVEIAAAVGEEAETIEEIYEPYLLKEGYLERTPRGRVATDLAFRHLRVERGHDANAQRALFDGES